MRQLSCFPICFVLSFTRSSYFSLFFFPFNHSGGVYTINYTKAFLCLLVETDRSIFFHYFFLFKTLFNFCCLLSYLQACQTSLTTRTSAVTSPRNPVNEWFLLLFEYRLMCGKKTEIFHLSIFLLYLSSHIFFPWLTDDRQRETVFLKSKEVDELSCVKHDLRGRVCNQLDCLFMMLEKSWGAK